MILFVVLKVIKCKLAVERKGNVVATGTLIEEKGSNRLVVINVAHKPNARLPFPNPYEIINVGDAIGFELDWPTSLVILETEHPQVCHFMSVVNLIVTWYFII